MGGIVGSIAGGLLGASGSKSAAKTQAASADRATEAQRAMFDKQVELQAPFREAGLTANNRLMYLLGLAPSGAGAAGGSSAKTADQLRAELIDQYTTTGPESFAEIGQYTIPGEKRIDEAGLNAAIQKRMAEQTSAPSAQFDTSDPAFGSLMRRFSMEDFEADPGYQFRMTEGMRGVEGGAAARGGLLSGAALKAIQKYGQGLASQEYGNAYGRFNADQTNQYNRLAGLVNTGQGATNQVSNAAGQFGQSQANNIIGAGNAQASGIMGMTNALTGGINQYMNTQNQNRLMDLIRKPGGGGWGTGDAYGNQDYGSYF